MPNGQNQKLYNNFNKLYTKTLCRDRGPFVGPSPQGGEKSGELDPKVFGSICGLQLIIGPGQSGGSNE